LQSLLQELLPVALQLHQLYAPAPLLPAVVGRKGRHPWAQLMAALVLAGESPFTWRCQHMLQVLQWAPQRDSDEHALLLECVPQPSFFPGKNKQKALPLVASTMCSEAVLWRGWRRPQAL
jgi:hypothetical protein